MLYSALRALLFRLDPETAHHVTLESLKVAHCLGLARGTPAPTRPVRVMGIDFPNPVGVAAGLDKNGEYLDALATLGCGFIEIGTVTPRPQPGNPRPRLFRLPEARAIINRMGFNNDGVERLLDNVRGARYRGILGINIGKNFDTPIERAAEDYVACLRKVYPHASYVTVNVSSPNTPELQQLQREEKLDRMLALLKQEQAALAQRHGKSVPLAVKIAPDLKPEEIDAIAGLLARHRVEAVIATNTTVLRQGVEGLAHANEAGGLSGAPLKTRATAAVQRLSQALRGEIPIIGVGGIMTAADAREKIAAGACLVQIYTGLIYRGPVLVREIVEELAAEATPC